MKRVFSAIFAVIVVACSAPAENASGPAYDGPVHVFLASKIYTGNPDAPVIGGVIVGETGRIVGTIPLDDEEGVIAPTGSLTMTDLGDAVMFPGFVDGHAHLLGIGQRELSLNLEGTSSITDLQARIAVYAETLPDGAVIEGRGWIETGWPERRMPVADDLDVVAPDHIVFLVRADGHALVANSRALELAGIDAQSVSVEGGRIERDAEGNPTGLLIDKAMAPVIGLQVAPTNSELRTAYIKAGEVYTARGWTGVHNMSVNPKHIPMLQALDNDGKMPLRLHNAFDLDGYDLVAKRRGETDTITNRAVKVYMDGALGSRGAQLLAPYRDAPETSGLSLFEDDQLASLMVRADADNVQLAIHAIGDKANRRVLDTVESLNQSEPDNAEAAPIGPENRWRIEHTQILNPADISRLSELGLIASMQPSHAIGDLKFASARLGRKRLRGAYAWASLLDAGTVIVGGSDAPVEVGSPLIEFYAAVARKDLDGESGRGWHPEEAVSREQALAMFTSAPAYAAFMEDDLGTIEIGKFADFTVFDRDLMTIPQAEILNANPVMTVVKGDIVYQTH